MSTAWLRTEDTHGSDAGTHQLECFRFPQVLFGCMWTTYSSSNAARYGLAEIFVELTDFRPCCGPSVVVVFFLVLGVDQ